MLIFIWHLFYNPWYLIFNDFLKLFLSVVCVYACWWRGTLNPSGLVSNSESHDTVDGNHIHVLCKNSVCFSLLSNLFIPKHLEKKIHFLFVSVSYSGYNISHLVLNCFTWIVWLIVIMLTYTINIIGLNGVSERWKTFRMQQPAMASASSVHKFPWSPQQITGCDPYIWATVLHSDGNWPSNRFKLFKCG